RLSFLGGRKKDQQGEKHRLETVNGENGVIPEEEQTPASATPGKENRRSFFRSQQQQQQQHNTSSDGAKTAVNGVDASPGGYAASNPGHANDWATDPVMGNSSESYSAGGLGEKQGMRVVESQVQAGHAPHHQHHHSSSFGVGSVRKRLSIL